MKKSKTVKHKIKGDWSFVERPLRCNHEYRIVRTWTENTYKTGMVVSKSKRYYEFYCIHCTEIKKKVI